MGNLIRKRRVRCRGGQRGQALVEFAIIIPVLLAVLLGIVEFARAWQIHQVVTNAAREGVRVSVGPGNTDFLVDAAIETYLLSANVDTAYASWTKTLDRNKEKGDPDTVTVSYVYQYSLFGPAISLLSGGSTPGSVTLSSTSIMRHEY